ncbi:MAG TPA: formate dehydrogenase accessory sulfurtransferase FdhD [Verrucomicrobiales bacterium]|nr:formate dehydrogenase accessory sulfurtransferase FdhD [Verrucomicrobiales bacterium]
MLVWKVGGNAPPRRESDEVATEEPLEIRIEGRAVSITLRTPGDDEELAAGFLLTEGVLSRASDIATIRPNPRNPGGNSIDLFLRPEVTVDFPSLTRHVFTSSSCGLCGKASIQAVCRRFRKLPTGFHIRASLLRSLPSLMRSAQPTFDRTGGLHAAALFDRQGKLLVLREDVGRHNAVDKVIGHALLTGSIPLDASILLVSGRASFEIVQKSLAARIPVVAAVSAPSSLAVDLARRAGTTLIGFLREGRMNLYAGRGRIR